MHHRSMHTSRQGQPRIQAEGCSSDGVGLCPDSPLIEAADRGSMSSRSSVDLVQARIARAYRSRAKALVAGQRR